MNIRQDYSYLFSNLGGSNNNNNIFNSINLSDYASIKSGSYGRLLKSYYNETSSQVSSIVNKNDIIDNKNNVTKDKNNTVDKTETTVDNSKKQEISDLQKNVDELQSSTGKLLQKGSTSLFKSEYKEEDKETLYNAVSDFVSDFNAMVEKGNASSFSSIAGMSGRLEDTAGDHQKALGEIGISFNKGKMTINKDAFMNADMDEVKKLFHETNSLGDFVSRRTENIESAISSVAKINNIDINAIKKEQQTASSNTDSINKAEARKQEMTNMQKYADELGNTANTLLQKGDKTLFKPEYTEEDKEALYEAVSDFVSDLNTVLEKGNASTVTSIVNMSGRMKDTVDDHKDMLKEIGVSVEEKNLTIDKDSFMNADMEKVKKLFNETDSFGYFVSQRAEAIEYAADNEANRNNIYTKDGTYNNIYAGTLYAENV